MTPAMQPKCEHGAAWMRDLHQRAMGWHRREAAGEERSESEAYIDLSFALGLATIGDDQGASELLARRQPALLHLDAVHAFLCRAFEYRVRQALNCTSGGPLPSEFTEELRRMDRMQSYLVDMLRKHSRLLEPDQNVNPYRHYVVSSDAFDREFAKLGDLTSREEFVASVRALLAQCANDRKARERRGRVVTAGLARCSLAGTEFIQELLAEGWKVRQAFPSTGDLNQLAEFARLLQTALQASASFRLRPEFEQFLRACEEWIGALDAAGLTLADGPLEECVLGLFELNLCDEADQFLHGTAQRLLGGRSLDEWDYVASEQNLARLRTLLPVAQGWSAFQWMSLAGPVYEKARALLSSDARWRWGKAADRLRNRMMLAVASVRALSLTTREVAAEHLDGLLEGLRGIRDTFTTASHFSIWQLKVVEAVVLTAVEVCRRG